MLFFSINNITFLPIFKKVLLSYPWLTSKNLDLRLCCCCITTTQAYVILSLLDSQTWYWGLQYGLFCYMPVSGNYGNGNLYPVNLSTIVGLSGWLPCSRFGFYHIHVHWKTRNTPRHQLVNSIIHMLYC